MASLTGEIGIEFKNATNPLVNDAECAARDKVIKFLDPSVNVLTFPAESAKWEKFAELIVQNTSFGTSAESLTFFICPPTYPPAEASCNLSAALCDTGEAGFAAWIRYNLIHVKPGIDTEFIYQNIYSDYNEKQVKPLSIVRQLYLLNNTISECNKVLPCANLRLWSNNAQVNSELSKEFWDNLTKLLTDNRNLRMVSILALCSEIPCAEDFNNFCNFLTKECITTILLIPLAARYRQELTSIIYHNRRQKFNESLVSGSAVPMVVNQIDNLHLRSGKVRPSKFQKQHLQTEIVHEHQQEHAQNREQQKQREQQQELSLQQQRLLEMEAQQEQEQEKTNLGKKPLERLFGKEDCFLPEMQNAITAVGAFDKAPINPQILWENVVEDSRYSCYSIQKTINVIIGVPAEKSNREFYGNELIDDIEYFHLPSGERVYIKYDDAKNFPNEEWRKQGKCSGVITFPEDYPADGNLRSAINKFIEGRLGINLWLSISPQKIRQYRILTDRNDEVSQTLIRPVFNQNDQPQKITKISYRAVQEIARTFEAASITGSKFLTHFAAGVNFANEQSGLPEGFFLVCYMENGKSEVALCYDAIKYPKRVAPNPLTLRLTRRLATDFLSPEAHELALLAGNDKLIYELATKLAALSKASDLEVKKHTFYEILILIEGEAVAKKLKNYAEIWASLTARQCQIKKLLGLLRSSGVKGIDRLFMELSRLREIDVVFYQMFCATYLSSSQNYVEFLDEEALIAFGKLAKFTQPQREWWNRIVEQHFRHNHATTLLVMVEAFEYFFTEFAKIYPQKSLPTLCPIIGFKNAPVQLERLLTILKHSKLRYIETEQLEHLAALDLGAESAPYAMSHGYFLITDEMQIKPHVEMSLDIDYLVMYEKDSQSFKQPSEIERWRVIGKQRYALETAFYRTLFLKVEKTAQEQYKNPECELNSESEISRRTGLINWLLTQVTTGKRGVTAFVNHVYSEEDLTHQIKCFFDHKRNVVDARVSDFIYFKRIDRLNRFCLHLLKMEKTAFGVNIRTPLATEINVLLDIFEKNINENKIDDEEQLFTKIIEKILFTYPIETAYRALRFLSINPRALSICDYLKRLEVIPIDIDKNSASVVIFLLFQALAAPDDKYASTVNEAIFEQLRRLSAQKLFYVEQILNSVLTFNSEVNQPKMVDFGAFISSIEADVSLNYAACYQAFQSNFPDIKYAVIKQEMLSADFGRQIEMIAAETISILSKPEDSKFNIPENTPIISTLFKGSLSLRDLFTKLDIAPRMQEFKSALELALEPQKRDSKKIAEILVNILLTIKNANFFLKKAVDTLLPKLGFVRQLLVALHSSSALTITKVTADLNQNLDALPLANKSANATIIEEFRKWLQGYLGDLKLDETFVASYIAYEKRGQKIENFLKALQQCAQNFLEIRPLLELIRENQNKITLQHWSDLFSAFGELSSPPDDNFKSSKFLIKFFDLQKETVAEKLSEISEILATGLKLLNGHKETLSPGQMMDLVNLTIELSGVSTNPQFVIKTLLNTKREFGKTAYKNLYSFIAEIIKSKPQRAQANALLNNEFSMIQNLWEILSPKNLQTGKHTQTENIHLLYPLLAKFKQDFATGHNILSALDGLLREPLSLTIFANKKEEKQIEVVDQDITLEITPNYPRLAPILQIINGAYFDLKAEDQVSVDAPTLIKQLDDKLSLAELTKLADLYSARPAPTALALSAVLQKNEFNLDNFIATFELNPHGTRADDFTNYNVEANLNRAREAIGEICHLEAAEQPLLRAEQTRLYISLSYIYAIALKSGFEIEVAGDAAQKKCIKDFTRQDMLAHQKYCRTIILNPFALPQEKYTAMLELLAMFAETLYRTTKKYPYSTQLLAVLTAFLDKKHVALQVNTGEGKTFITALIAAMQFATSPSGHSVDVCTADKVLAKTNSGEMKDFFLYQGISTALIVAGSPVGTYKTGGINYFDMPNLSLYRSCRRVLRDEKRPKSVSLILDEVDKLLLDEKTRFNFAISLDTNTDPNSNEYDWIYPLINEFVQREDFSRNVHDEDGFAQDGAWSASDDISRLRVYLEEKTQANKRNRKMLDATSDAVLDRWLDSALTVKRDVELHAPQGYAIFAEKHKISGIEKVYLLAQVLDDGGRPSNSKWSDGVQQLLHAKLNTILHYIVQGKVGVVPFGLTEKQLNNFETAVKRELNNEGLRLDTSLKDNSDFSGFPIERELIFADSRTSKDFWSFYNNYHNGCRGRCIGLTGTLGGTAERGELNHIYSTKMYRIPPHKENRRYDLPPIIAKDDNEQLQLIINELRINARSGRPLMLHCHTIGLAEYFSSKLTRFCEEHQYKLNLANGLQKEDESILVDRAGGQENKKVLTITTTFGRGTDIKVKHPEGLFVLATDVLSERKIRQLKGRAGRAGWKGETREIINGNYYPDLLGKSAREVELKLEELRENKAAEEAKIRKFKEQIVGLRIDILQNQADKWVKFLRESGAEKAGLEIKSGLIRDLYKAWELSLQSKDPAGELISIYAMSETQLNVCGHEFFARALLLWRKAELAFEKAWSDAQPNCVTDSEEENAIFATAAAKRAAAPPVVQLLPIPEKLKFDKNIFAERIKNRRLTKVANAPNYGANLNALHNVAKESDVSIYLALKGQMIGNKENLWLRALHKQLLMLLQSSPLHGPVVIAINALEAISDFSIQNEQKVQAVIFNIIENYSQAIFKILPNYLAIFDFEDASANQFLDTFIAPVMQVLERFEYIPIRVSSEKPSSWENKDSILKFSQSRTAFMQNYQSLILEMLEKGNFCLAGHMAKCAAQYGVNNYPSIYTPAADDYGNNGGVTNFNKMKTLLLKELNDYGNSWFIASDRKELLQNLLNNIEHVSLENTERKPWQTLYGLFNINIFSIVDNDLRRGRNIGRSRFYKTLVQCKDILRNYAGAMEVDKFLKLDLANNKQIVSLVRESPKYKASFETTMGRESLRQILGVDVCREVEKSAPLSLQHAKINRREKYTKIDVTTLPLLELVAMIRDTKNDLVPFEKLIANAIEKPENLAWTQKIWLDAAFQENWDACFGTVPTDRKLFVQNKLFEEALHKLVRSVAGDAQSLQQFSHEFVQSLPESVKAKLNAYDAWQESNVTKQSQISENKVESDLKVKQQPAKISAVSRFSYAEEKPGVTTAREECIQKYLNASKLEKHNLLQNESELLRLLDSAQSIIQDASVGNTECKAITFLVKDSNFIALAKKASRENASHWHPFFESIDNALKVNANGCSNDSLAELINAISSFSNTMCNKTTLDTAKGASVVVSIKTSSIDRCTANDTTCFTNSGAILNSSKQENNPSCLTLS